MFFKRNKVYGDGSYQLYEPGEEIDINKKKFRFKHPVWAVLVLVFWVTRSMVGF